MASWPPAHTSHTLSVVALTQGGYASDEQFHLPELQAALSLNVLNRGQLLEDSFSLINNAGLRKVWQAGDIQKVIF